MSESEIHALLGRGTRYEGKLVFEGCVRIDGSFEGTIHSEDTLIVGEEAEVRADVGVGTLIVLGGAMHGQVRAANLVELHAPARIYADIHTPQLFIDKGVHFEGKCTMAGGRVDPLQDTAADAATP